MPMIRAAATNALLPTIDLEIFNTMSSYCCAGRFVSCDRAKGDPDGIEVYTLTVSGLLREWRKTMSCRQPVVSSRAGDETNRRLGSPLAEIPYGNAGKSG